MKVKDKQTISSKVSLPRSVVKNGTMFLCVFGVPKVEEADRKRVNWWQKVISGPETSYTLTRLDKKFGQLNVYFS